MLKGPNEQKPSVSLRQWLSRLDWALTVPVMVVGLLALQAARPLNFDEGIYFTIARDIRTFGLPVWTWNGVDYLLFQNSPPLVLYLGSVMQRLSPHNAVIATRLMMLVLFTGVPLASIWPGLRRHYGTHVAATAVMVVFFSWFITDESFRFRLDAALGGIAWLCLSALHGLATRQGATVGRLLFVAALLCIAFLTKFQAVCIFAAGVTWGTHMLAVGRRDELPSINKAGLIVVVAGVSSIAGWLIFTRIANAYIPTAAVDQNTAQGFAGVFRYNLERIFNHGSGTSVLWQFLIRFAEPTARRVGVLAVIIAVGCLLRASLSPLEILTLHFSVITVAFNALTYNMPGAGGQYLVSLAPAVCIPVAIGLTEAGRRPWKVSLWGLLALHLTLNLPHLNQVARTSDAQMEAAAAIGSGRSEGPIGVSNQMWAIGYFTGRPLVHLDEITRAEVVRLTQTGVFGIRDVVVSRSFEDRLHHEGVLPNFDQRFGYAKSVPVPDGNDIVVYSTVNRSSQRP